MNGKHRRVFVSDGLMWPNGLSLDLVNQELYWCDGYTNNIERIGLSGTNRKVGRHFKSYKIEIFQKIFEKKNRNIPKNIFKKIEIFQKIFKKKSKYSKKYLKKKSKYSKKYLKKYKYSKKYSKKIEILQKILKKKIKIFQKIFEKKIEIFQN